MTALNAFMQQVAQTVVKVIHAADWLLTDPPAPDQILADMLDAGDKLAVLASSKLRKSFFFLQLALALAAGRDFLGWRISRPRRVVYIQFEVREHHTHRRLRKLARAMGISAADIEDRLLIIPARGLGLKGAEGLEQIRQAVADFKPEVIMFDPLYKVAEGVENAAEDFKKLLDAFDKLAEDTGAAIMFVHHDTKGSPGDKDIRDRGAGSNVLGRDYDACITLTAHASEPDATVVETLLRNYPPQDPFTIIWESSEAGYCFALADDILPDKKTSRTKPAPPAVATYLPFASEILFAGNELEVKYFKALFKERTGLSDNRIKDFLNWSTGGPRPHLLTRAERGRGINKKWVRLNEGRQDV